jgi:hypothetical protein
MPFRLPGEFPDRAKIQFTTSLSMPAMIYRACVATGTVSNTVYCQHAVAEALSRDLGIPLQTILDELPAPRTASNHLFDPADAKMTRGRDIRNDHSGGQSRIGPGNTVEEVR